MAFKLNIVLKIAQFRYKKKKQGNIKINVNSLCGWSANIPKSVPSILLGVGTSVMAMISFRSSETRTIFSTCSR